MPSISERIAEIQRQAQEKALSEQNLQKNQQLTNETRVRELKKVGESLIPQARKYFDESCLPILHETATYFRVPYQFTSGNNPGVIIEQLQSGGKGLVVGKLLWDFKRINDSGYNPSNHMVNKSFSIQVDSDGYVLCSAQDFSRIIHPNDAVAHNNANYGLDRLQGEIARSLAGGTGFNIDHHAEVNSRFETGEQRDVGW